MKNSEEIERLLFQTVLKLRLKQLFEEPKIHLKRLNNLKMEKHTLWQRERASV